MAFNDAIDHIEWPDLDPAAADLPAVKHHIEKLELSRVLRFWATKFYGNRMHQKNIQKKRIWIFLKNPWQATV